MKLAAVGLMMRLLSAVSAEEGWIFTGDLNGDGIDDTIRSGPQELFGNGGGPFVLTLSQADGGVISQEIFMHPLAVAYEHYEGGESRHFLWLYLRSGGSEGLLQKIELDEHLTTSVMVINPGDGGTEIGNAVYNAIFSRRLRFLKDPDYTVPAHPAGGEWGK